MTLFFPQPNINSVINVMLIKITSSFVNNSLAVGADTMIPRAVAEIKPSSTALSIKDNKQL